MINHSHRPVVLVYPYFWYRDPVQKLFPPLGILTLAGQLRESGIPAYTCDCTFLSFHEAVKRIVAARPSVLGMYVMVTMTRNALELLHILRVSLPDTLFVAGGPLPSVYPDRFAAKFDVVFRGEGDITFSRFCHTYLSSGYTPTEVFRLPLASYPGIYLRSPEGLMSTPPIHQPVSVLDALPLPDRSDTDHLQYQHFWRENAGYTATSIIITRGCPFTCDFCSKPVWGNIYRKPSLTRTFREIEDITGLGYDQIWVADDSFTLDLTYLRRFCEEKIARELPISWTCLSRVDRLNEEIVSLMKEAGCAGVYLGLESGNDETLQLMGKRTMVADGERAVHLFQEAGIATAGFFLVGYPGESIESIEQTLAAAVSLPLNEISINVPYPLPGSALFERVGGVDSEGDWQAAGEITFLYQSEFDQEWLRDRIGSTVAEFRERRGSSCAHIPTSNSIRLRSNSGAGR